MLWLIYKQITFYILQLPVCIYSRNPNKAELEDYSRVEKTLYIMNTWPQLPKENILWQVRWYDWSQYHCPCGKVYKCGHFSGALWTAVIILLMSIDKTENNVWKYQHTLWFLAMSSPKISCCLLKYRNSWLLSIICHLKHFAGSPSKLHFIWDLSSSWRGRRMCKHAQQKANERQGLEWRLLKDCYMA